MSFSRFPQPILDVLDAPGAQATLMSANLGKQTGRAMIDHGSDGHFGIFFPDKIGVEMEGPEACQMILARALALDVIVSPAPKGSSNVHHLRFECVAWDNLEESL